MKPPGLEDTKNLNFYLLVSNRFYDMLKYTPHTWKKTLSLGDFVVITLLIEIILSALLLE